jgi:hypothetical protein
MEKTNLTPVEWIVDQIFGSHSEIFRDKIDIALEMERERIREIYLKKAMEKFLPKVDKSKIERYV